MWKYLEKIVCYNGVGDAGVVVNFEYIFVCMSPPPGRTMRA